MKLIKFLILPFFSILVLSQNKVNEKLLSEVGKNLYKNGKYEQVISWIRPHPFKVGEHRWWKTHRTRIVTMVESIPCWMFAPSIACLDRCWRSQSPSWQSPLLQFPPHRRAKHCRPPLSPGITWRTHRQGWSHRAQRQPSRSCLQLNWSGRNG